MKGHERILLLAAAAIDFPLAPEEAAELEAHLRSCDACRSTAARLRGDAALIAALPRRTPSAEVGTRIVEAAHGARSIGSRPALVLVAAALLVVAALIGAAIAGALLLRTRELPISLVPPPSSAIAAPTTSPSPPAATPTPEPTIPPGQAWRVVTPTGTPGLSGVVAGGPGWIGVGGGAWTSSDGRTWTAAAVEGVEPCSGTSRCAGLTEVAAGVGGFVAIGEDPNALGSWQIWQSVDGQDWQIVGSGPEFELGTCIEGCPSMTDVAGGPSGFVAIGYRTGGAQVAWFSPDGLHWETLPVKTFEDAESAVNLAGVAADGTRFVIAGYLLAPDGSAANDRPAFWTSTDGRAWTRTSPDRVSQPSAVPYTVVARGTGFVAVGGCRDGDKPCAVAWTSPDGVTWTQRTIDASESPRFAGVGASGEAAASNGGRVIAFSDSGTAVWTSDDGLEWTRHEVDAPPLFFEAAAGGELGFIAMGLDIAETAYYAWLSP